SQLEPRSPCRAGHLDDRPFGGVDAGEKDASVERVQPGTSPPPARQDERSRQQPGASAVLAREYEPEESAGADGQCGDRRAGQVGDGDSETESRDERMG